MRIDRMLSITMMLLNRDRISAREFAERFEVSVRTVYRDIEAINMAGIPIVSYPGNDGGFGIMENYKVDRRLLSLNDMLNILTALKGINTGLEDREVESAIEKISGLVPREQTGRMREMLEQIVIDIAPYGRGEKYRERLRAIQRSIAGNGLTRITYTSVKGERLERVIEPMTLLVKGHAWYLFAFCRERNDYRVFRLSRIKDVEEMEEGFARREASYKQYTQWDRGAQAASPLVLKFSPEARVRVEDFFDEEQMEVRENGEILVRVPFPEDEWLYSLILSYGEHVEVLEPPHIKKIIVEKAKKMLERHESPS